MGGRGGGGEEGKRRRKNDCRRGKEGKVVQKGEKKHKVRRLN